MKYQIELAATAKADIRRQAHWLLEPVAPAAAEKWLDELYKAIDTLQTRPLRCPFTAESDWFPEEIRELHYGMSGKRQHKHRIIFAIRNETVRVLYVVARIGRCEIADKTWPLAAGNTVPDAGAYMKLPGTDDAASSSVRHLQRLRWLDQELGLGEGTRTTAAWARFTEAIWAGDQDHIMK
jgi:plasmid stabilization system protein ParE